MTKHRGLIPAVRACGFVLWHWENLLDARIPGTRRPWAQTMSRAESRARSNRRNDGGGDLGMSKAPAPIHLDAVDAAVEVHRIGWELATEVRDYLGDVPTDLPTSVGDDARPYWAYLARVLDRAAEEMLVGDIERLYERIHNAKNLVSTTLRLVLDGHTLDADCPWCGARPLRVRIVAEEPLVVCEARRICEPPEADCGVWVRERPAWPREEWDWLARRIAHAEERSA